MADVGDREKIGDRKMSERENYIIKKYNEYTYIYVNVYIFVLPKCISVHRQHRLGLPSPFLHFFLSFVEITEKKNAVWNTRVPRIRRCESPSVGFRYYHDYLC